MSFEQEVDFLLNRAHNILFQIPKTQMKYEEIKNNWLEYRYKKHVEKEIKPLNKKAFFKKENCDASKIFWTVLACEEMFILNAHVKQQIAEIKQILSAPSMLSKSPFITLLIKLVDLISVVADLYKKNDSILKNVFPKKDKRNYIPSNDSIHKGLTALGDKEAYHPIDILTRSITSYNGAISIKAKEEVKDVLYHLEKTRQSLGPSARDTFVYIMQESCAKNMNKDVVIDINHYMDCTGKTVCKNNIDRLIKDLEIMDTVDFHVEGVIGRYRGQERILSTNNLLTYSIEYLKPNETEDRSKWRIQRIRVHLGDWVDIIKVETEKKLVMELPPEGLKINDKKFPLATMFGTAMLFRYRENQKKRKQQHDSISIETLYSNKTGEWDRLIKQIDKHGLFGAEKKAPYHKFIANINEACKQFNFAWEWKNGEVPTNKKEFLSGVIVFVKTAPIEEENREK